MRRLALAPLVVGGVLTGAVIAGVLNGYIWPVALTAYRWVHAPPCNEADWAA